MDVRDAVASRYSCRAFRPDPVPLTIVREILERAARAPSGGNVQPWLVHALAGDRLEALEDRPARYRQFSRNYLLYDAPVGLFVSLDRQMGPPQWSDAGGFIQTVMLLARAHGLHTCAQEAWTSWHKTVSAFLELPSEHILFCGIALGVADEAAPINAWRSEREPV